jgi:hypothetical protein
MLVVLDILLKTNYVRFWRRNSMLLQKKQSYLAKLPRRYEGQYGPGIKALIPALYFGMGTSEPKIWEFLTYVGIQLSEGKISNLLI